MVGVDKEVEKGVLGIDLGSGKMVSNAAVAQALANETMNGVETA